MKSLSKLFAQTCWVVSCCGLLGCQEPVQKAPPQDPPKAQDADQLVKEVAEQFRKEGITVDPKAQTVTIKVFVNEPADPIEYLLVHKRGKRHEAMFWTDSKPSVFNAALLMLGLQPGKNATYVEKDPPPTIEQIEAGADPIVVTPPKGMNFWMTVRWTGEDGKPVELCVEDLLLDLSTQKPVVDCSWVYLGGRMAAIYRNEPEVYVADFEGNLISVCYLSPDNHLGTMSHKDARDDQNWWLTNKLPPAERPVELVIHRVRPKLHEQREARLKQEAEAEAKENAAGGEGGKETPPKDGGK